MGVVQTGVDYFQLRLPLGVQVRVCGVGGRSHGADVYQFADARLFGHRGHVGRPLPVYTVKSRAPPGADDAHQMHNGLYVVERLLQGVGVHNAAVMNLNGLVVENPLTARRVNQAARLVPARQKFARHAPSQKPGGPRHQNQQERNPSSIGVGLRVSW